MPGRLVTSTANCRLGTVTAHCLLVTAVVAVQCTGHLYSYCWLSPQLLLTADRLPLPITADWSPAGMVVVRCGRGFRELWWHAWIKNAAMDTVTRDPSMAQLCPSWKQRHYSGNRHYSMYCQYWLFRYVSSDFTGATAGNRHYRGTTMNRGMPPVTHNYC